jgi:hypothetical protein
MAQISALAPLPGGYRYEKLSRSDVPALPVLVPIVGALAWRSGL